MTDDQLMGILNKFDPNGEYPSYYHESNVLSAMREAMRLESIEFFKWVDSQQKYYTYNNKTWFPNEDEDVILTIEQLFNEYLNQSK